MRRAEEIGCFLSWKNFIHQRKKGKTALKFSRSFEERAVLKKKFSEKKY